MPRYQVFVEAIIMEVSVREPPTGRRMARWHLADDRRTAIPILFGNTPAKELSSLRGSNPPSLAGWSVSRAP